MLSTPTPNFNPGRQQRQNSTPNIFANSDDRLTTRNPQHVSHRRGLSLDQPTNTQHRWTGSLQHEHILDFTPRGLDIYQRHPLQEAQKQRPLAGPGQEKPTQQSTEQGPLRIIEPKPYPEYGNYIFTNDLLISTTPFLNDGNLPQKLDANTAGICHEQHSFDTNNFADNLEGFEIVARPKDAPPGCEREARRNSTPKGGDLVDSTRLKPSSQAEPERPCTPQNQTNSCYFPLTPEATPFAQIKTSLVQAGNRKVESPTKDPNSTIRASQAMKRGPSVHDLFSPNPITAAAIETLSPPNSERLQPVESTDLVDFPELNLMDLSTMNMDLFTKPPSHKSSYYSPMSKTISSHDSSFHSSPDRVCLSSFESSPEITHSSLFGLPEISISEEGSNSQSFPPPLEFESYSPPPKQSVHSRSQSISDLDIDATVEDTGISSEEIAAYISGPDHLSGRWTCTYPDCNRGFGRKENIKSHVQTHLGDRQYRCIHCGSTFVRQHDLKRHAKIHSGIKPYPCPCGSTFARHDALTRHRQRNTCSGGFEGKCKSPTKRGRPRKIRPDGEARQSKAAKTRQHARARASSASPSHAGMTMAEDLPELPPSQAMSRETSTSYCSTSSDIDMFPPLSSPLPTFDFDFDLGSMEALEAHNLGGSSLPDLNEEIDLMLPSSIDIDIDIMDSLDRKLIEQLEEFNSPLSPLPDRF